VTSQTFQNTLHIKHTLSILQCFPPFSFSAIPPTDRSTESVNTHDSVNATAMSNLKVGTLFLEVITPLQQRSVFF
jgi:hypothetical protein